MICTLTSKARRKSDEMMAIREILVAESHPSSKPQLVYLVIDLLK